MDTSGGAGKQDINYNPIFNAVLNPQAEPISESGRSELASILDQF
jgi:hypothetical protein